MERYQGLVRRLQAVILSLMNFDYCFTKTVSCALIFVMLMTTACSSTQVTSSQTVVDAESIQPDIVPQEVPERELAPTDTELMYNVFAAEILGSEGDVSAAAAEYLEAALVSEDPEIAERAARIAVSAGEWQMVALASGRWAMLDPLSREARELAAGSRLREGDYVGAEYQLGRLLALSSADQAEGWRTVMALLAPSNDKVRVNKVLDNLLKEFDAESNVDALFARSHLAAQDGDLVSASNYVDLAIELDPARADLYAWSGRVAVNRSMQSLALSRYKQAWQTAPDDPNIAMAYAELLKRNNELETAQSVLAQLTDTPNMRFARIIFAIDAGDRNNGEMLYQGFATAQYEDASEAAFFAGQSAELLEHPSEAIDWYQQVTGERSVRAAMRQAFLLARTDEIDQARELLQQLRSQADDNVRSQSYQVEAQILQGAGRKNQAFNVFNEALADLPEDVSIRYGRALLAVGLNKLELAESDLTRVIAAQPDNAAAINALGYTLADLTDRFDEAERLINQAYQLQPDDASIIDSMGWISYRRGRLKEATSYLREAWKLMRNAEVAAHLGEVLWVDGQKDEARSLWQLGVQMEGDNEVLNETMQRFGELP
jgi:tetratricopeptide (TPR) repeat protein